MEKIHNYQIQMLESDMNKLKKKTGKDESKAALEKAVEWALERKG